MSKHVEEAVAAFNEGYNCAQSVLVALAPELGLSREEAVRVASGFGGGMARQGDTCGAVTGAMMALGLAQGSAQAEEAAKQRVYASVEQLFREFQERNGSRICRDLLGCDLGTEEGRRKAHETGITKERCPAFVSSAVEIVDSILAGS